MDDALLRGRAARVFSAVLGRPWSVLGVAAVTLAALVACVPFLTRDSSAEAFIARDHPAVVHTALVESTFGLSDPVIVAVVNDGPRGVFNPASLNLVTELTRRVRAMEGVDPERVTSLATERAIAGRSDGFTVAPFWEGPISTDAEAEAVRTKVMALPLFQGNLVARDGSATVIVVELLNRSYGNTVYHAVTDLAASLEDGQNAIYVAGEGAVAEHLSEYVDADARRVYPIAFLVIVAILTVAYRSLRGTVLPLIVVGGSLIAAIGSMAALGVPYYIITSALPAILIAISVADGIHILGQYYEEVAKRPSAPRRELLARTMAEMWHPVVYTSLTDAAGFAALALASTMPPMRAFGLFATIGVLASMTLSLFVFPVILSLLPVRASGAFRAVGTEGSGTPRDPFGRFMGSVGAVVLRHPRAILAVAAIVALAGIAGAARLEVNYQRIDYFHHDEPIFRADAVMNERFNGTHFFDVVFETDRPEGLFDPEALRAMEGLQEFLNTLPHVQGSTSIVDYLKQINRALNEDSPDAHVLPNREDLVAQFFLLYANAGDPTDLEHLIDYDYRTANVRVAMNSGLYSDTAVALEAVRAYLDGMENVPGLTVTLAGRGNITYYWVKELARSHFLGVVWAMVAVWLTASYSFRSFAAGLFAIAPVGLSILSIYAVMGALGIWLGVGTSMFAAIGIGISVNFAIHTLDRTLELVRMKHDDVRDALISLYPSTGRSLLFNFSCVFLGFGVLTSSQVPPLNAFGILVAVAVAMSFIASITVLPAMMVVFRPRFLREREDA